MDITISRIAQSRLPSTDFRTLPFGHTFSDHMFIADYIDGEWRDLRIVPYGDISISPANMAIHYGQAIFEGMKAHWNEAGYPSVFRPNKNLERINKSAARLCMPQISEEIFFEALDLLLTLDQDWIPRDPASALYIRPVMFANDGFLGVKASDSYRFMIFTGPTGPYYTSPVKLWVETTYVRSASHGGVGFAKAAGNYAASIMPATHARERGFDQVLWLDANEFKYLQECGTMNIFVVIGDTVITPPLGDSILAGVTRDSIITLFREQGVSVEERNISIDELVEAYHAGQLREVFGAGTAAVISHVSEIGYRDLLMKLPALEDRKLGPAMKAHFEALKCGQVPDTHNWLHCPIADVVKA